MTIPFIKTKAKQVLCYLHLNVYLQVLLSKYDHQLQL